VTRSRVWLLLAAAFVALLLSLGRWERKASARLEQAGAEAAALDELANAAASLQSNVLEARAGILLYFDPIDRSVKTLRSAPRAAARLRARGPRYAQAADALDRMAEDAHKDEQAVESLKTDLSLLRSSSIYFPAAAAALQRDEALAHKVEAVRADVERFELGPTREIAQRLDVEIGALEQARTSSAQGEAAQVDLGVVIGHARAVVERRERADRTAQALAQSAARADADDARAAFERAIRHDVALAATLRSLLPVVALALLGALVSAWRERKLA